jgi:hypothetical protein
MTQGREGRGVGGPKRELTLFDAANLIVGIIVGAGIYETANTVAAGAVTYALTEGRRSSAGRG